MTLLRKILVIFFLLFPFSHTFAVTVTKIDVQTFNDAADGNHNFMGGPEFNKDGTKKSFKATEIRLEETAYSTVRGRKIPTKWKISLLGENTRFIYTEALNNYSWMETSIPYWEGPISFSGDFSGVGYLEMTGY